MTAIRRVALVGLPGSGKSTIAPPLAALLGWRCLDTDAEIEENWGASIASMMESRGETAFRSVELDTLTRALTGAHPLVISCGGGMMTGERARRLLLEETCVVWLDAPDEVLLGRLGKAADRPLLRENPARRLAELRADRLSDYGKAHLRVDSSSTPEAVAEHVHRALTGALRIDIPGHGHLVSVRPGAVDDVALHVPAAAARAAVVADSSVTPLAVRIAQHLRDAGTDAFAVGLDGGESVKTWAAAGRLLEELAGRGVGRRDCLVAVGGGTIGDLCGFAAATYLRGIAWINVPTTLLAMVDSAVGGKTGVNLPQGKNLAGAFWQPHAVICDTDVLAGLPDRAFQAAFAEIIKYAMIDGGMSADQLDGRLDALLDRDPGALAEVVERCCTSKGAVVSADEREGDLRAILNYGHTVGHALEAATGYGDALWHGEALAVGMRVAGSLSRRQLGCPDGDIRWQDIMLARCGLGRSPNVGVDAVIDRLAADKKAVAGTVRWVLLEERGRPRTGQLVPEALVRESLAAVLPG
ncbi:MAG: 3-dehydroquinate synthase [Candidatus Dormibacteria bacterium]